MYSVQLVTRRKSDRQYLLLCVNFVWLFRLRFKSRYTCMLYVFFCYQRILVLSSYSLRFSLYLKHYPNTLAVWALEDVVVSCCFRRAQLSPLPFRPLIRSWFCWLLRGRSGVPTGRCCCFRLICLLLLLLLLSIVVVGQAGCVCSGGGSFLIFFFLASKRCRKCVLSCFVITVLFPQYFFPY